MNLRPLAMMLCLGTLLVPAVGCGRGGESPEARATVNEVSSNTRTNEQGLAVGTNEGVPAAGATPGSAPATGGEDERDVGAGGRLPESQTGGARLNPSIEDAVQVRVGEHKISMPVTIPAGAVTFDLVNEGSSYHNISIEGVHQDNTEPMQPGNHENVQVALEPGPYRFYCTIGDHASKGESVVVTAVEPTALTGSPALTDSIRGTDLTEGAGTQGSQAQAQEGAAPGVGGQPVSGQVPTASGGGTGTSTGAGQSGQGSARSGSGASGGGQSGP